MNLFEEHKDVQKFQAQQKISPEIYNQYKDMAEKKFIMEALSELPIDKLKELVSFSFINPYDGKIPASYEEDDYRHKLQKERAVELRMEMFI